MTYIDGEHLSSVGAECTSRRRKGARQIPQDELYQLSLSVQSRKESSEEGNVTNSHGNADGLSGGRPRMECVLLL